jgi:hypothetical protein
MSKAVKISDDLVTEATRRAKIMSRSTAGQIEYWAHIGQIAEDNPDLPYSFIKDILISMAESKAGLVEDYIFGEGDPT